MSARAFFPIKNFMTQDPVTIDSTASIEEALTLMENTGVRHLPVLKDKCLAGVISDRDLARALSQPTSKKIREVGEIMSPAPFTVAPEEDMKKVLQIMASNKLGSVVIKTHGERISGIFTTTDAVSLLAKVFS